MRAAIDAGSNTLRLLVGEISGGKVVPNYYLRRICRLAGGFSQEEGLSPEARGRTLVALQDFAAFCRQADVRQVRAVGTAAFRQAVNGREFANEIRSVTNLPFEIISGEMEAECMTIGVLSALDPVPENALIVDIGGGSTELVLCLGNRIAWSCSLPLGVVRLAETCTSQRIRQQRIEEALDGINDQIISTCLVAGLSHDQLAFIGTAGSVTTLAALDMQMTEYDWRQVNNYTLSLSRLQSWQARLAPLLPAEREALPGMEPGRGDLITAGLDILLYLMQQLRLSRLTASDFGILEGLLLSLDNTAKTESFD